MLLFEFGVLLVLDCFFLLEFDDVFETRSVSRGVRICLVFREGKESFQGSLALGWNWHAWLAYGSIDRCGSRVSGFDVNVTHCTRDGDGDGEKNWAGEKNSSRSRGSLS
jgi:hypothetical protein